MHDTIIFVDTETEDEICQYIGKGFIIPNVDELVSLEKDDKNVDTVVVERTFSYKGDWTTNCVVVTIWVKIAEEL